MNFYVYRVNHIETNEFYFGSRGCKCLPEKDIKYMGSMSTWKPDKSKLVKTIIKSDFETRTDALIYESSLIKENIENTLNRNYHIPNIGFQTYGYISAKDKNGKISLVSIDDPKFLTGELIHINTGKVVVKDKNGNNYQVNIDDPKFLSGEYVTHIKGKITVKDKNGNTLQIDVNDPRFLTKELIGINTNMIPVKDKDGNIYQVTKDDPRYLSKELVHVTTDKVVVKDSNGKTFMVDRNDPKYLSGEYIHIFKGKIIVKDKEGNTFQVDINDPRFLSGEFVGIHKGIPPYNKGKKMSEEQKEKLRKPKTEEHKRKLSLVNKGKGGKKIICLNNGIIYPSISSACKGLGVTHPNVLHVLKKRAQNTKGFMFEYYID